MAKDMYQVMLNEWTLETAGEEVSDRAEGVDAEYSKEFMIARSCQKDQHIGD